MTSISIFEKWKIPTYDDPQANQMGEVVFDYDKCSGCQLCIKTCPSNALFLDNKQPVMHLPGVNECMACGDCVAICAEDAILVMQSVRCTGKYKTIDQGDLLSPRLQW